jgi:hypothetical protein
VSVVDATYLRFSFNATPMGWARISAIAPGAGEHLVGPPAEQERVGALVDRTCCVSSILGVNGAVGIRIEG